MGCLVSETWVDAVDHGKSPPPRLEEPVGQLLTVAALMAERAALEELDRAADRGRSRAHAEVASRRRAAASKRDSVAFSVSHARLYDVIGSVVSHSTMPVPTTALQRLRGPGHHALPRATRHSCRASLPGEPCARRVTDFDRRGLN
jgi:hypothetical protein